MAAASQVGLFQFELIKVTNDEQFNSPVLLAILEALTGHTRPVVITLGTTDTGHAHLCRKFYWMVLL